MRPENRSLAVAAQYQQHVTPEPQGEFTEPRPARERSLPHAARSTVDVGIRRVGGRDRPDIQPARNSLLPTHSQLTEEPCLPSCLRSRGRGRWQRQSTMASCRCSPVCRSSQAGERDSVDGTTGARSLLEQLPRNGSKDQTPGRPPSGIPERSCAWSSYAFSHGQVHGRCQVVSARKSMPARANRGGCNDYGCNDAELGVWSFAWPTGGYGRSPRGFPCLISLYASLSWPFREDGLTQLSTAEDRFTAA